MRDKSPDIRLQSHSAFPMKQCLLAALATIESLIFSGCAPFQVSFLCTVLSLFAETRRGKGKFKMREWVRRSFVILNLYTGGSLIFALIHKEFNKHKLLFSLLLFYYFCLKIRNYSINIECIFPPRIFVFATQQNCYSRVTRDHKKLVNVGLVSKKCENPKNSFPQSLTWNSK